MIFLCYLLLCNVVPFMIFHMILNDRSDMNIFDIVMLSIVGILCFGLGIVLIISVIYVYLGGTV